MKAIAFLVLLAGIVAAVAVAGAGSEAPRLEALETQVKAKAPSFELKTAEGKAYSLKSLTQDSDLVVLYFISWTCPVNAEALEYITPIANAANGKKVKFVGITNANASQFKDWQAKFKAKYPVLLDPQKKVIQAYGAERSPWFILVNKSGEIVHTDKGYSASSLAELNERIAKVESRPAVKVDLKGAPSDMAYG